MSPDQRLGELAARTFGVFTTEQVLTAGLSPDQVTYRLRTGRWERLGKGVYRLTGAPKSPESHLFAATVIHRGVASHRSAAWLHGLEQGVLPVEVSAELRTGHRRHGARVHRTADLSPSDVTMVRGIRTTDATRTCIDMGARLGEAQLHRLVDRALHKGLTTEDRLVRRFLQLARRGRDGIATVRSVLELISPELGLVESDLETLLVRLLNAAGLPPPDRQVTVHTAGQQFRLDFAYVAQKIAVECDGFGTHGTRHAFEDDRRRQNLLVLAGWRVLRFTWRQVTGSPDWVAAQVRRALRGAT
jgi:very-short-patch-repair endonuclease